MLNQAELSNITIDEIAPVLKLYEKGLYLQAYNVASQLRPLAEWRGGRARGLAGRLATQLGAPRLGQWHHLLAWREAPHLPEAKLYYVWTIMNRHGPYAAWRLLKRFGDLTEAPPRILSDWYALHATTVAMLRDFDTAEFWLAQASAIAPDDAWVHITRSLVLQLEDRYQESLDAALHALSLRPWYRPAVQAAADAQVRLSRDEEALAILTEADGHIQCAALVLRQIGLLIEHQGYQEAQDQLERLIELMPLMETEVAQAIAGLQSDISYFLNDIDAAIEYSRQSDRPFFKIIAEHLAEPARRGAQRVVLPVEFVRQHYQTCVPATLTIISRFWSQPAEHLQIAEKICYDGTTAYSERVWAEQNGWMAREFTVTEESTAALIDRGVPFTLTTVSPGNAHMQAVIGYDGRRGTILIRDPYLRPTIEALAEELLQQQAATGPRGMALVPAGMRERLDMLELPDDVLWDQAHQFDGALERHRWPDAEQIYQEMVISDPAHRLTKQARLRLAIYDANPVAELAAIESLLKQYPDDEPLNLARLSRLSGLGRRDELLAAYKKLCARKDAHPIFRQQYAQELAFESHRSERAAQLLSHAIRRWPMEAGSYFILANILWQQQKHEDALELYRFAICLKDKEESFARTYFNASLFMEQAEEALQFLNQRWMRFGNRSSMTARTLAWAYGQLGRWKEAIEVLDEALAEFPEDGELMLEAAELLAQASSDYFARAGELLTAAKGKAPHRQWLRSAANLMVVQGKPASSLEMWLKLLEIQPLAIDAHKSVVQLLARAEGQEAALAHLQKYVRQFPHYYPLQELLVKWNCELRLVEGYLLEARKLVDLAPQNDVSLGALGEALLWNNQSDEANEVLQAAVELNPANGFAGELLFDLQLQQGELSAAAKTLKLFEHYFAAAFTSAKSIQLAVMQEDRERIMGEFEKLCVTPDERGWALWTAVNAMTNVGMQEDIFEILDKAVNRPDAVPEVGSLWMNGCIAYGDQGCIRRLEDCLCRLQDLTAVGAVGERATAAYLMSLQGNDQLLQLSHFIEHNHHWLVENAEICSHVVFALQQLGEKEEAITWTQDLRQLQDLKPSMLIAPVELYWDAVEMGEVVEVSQKALLLTPDYATPIHRIWLAAEAVFRDDAESAEGHLGFVNPIKLDPQSRVLYRMTDAVVQISVAAESERRQVFQRIRGQIEEVMQEIDQLHEVSETHRRFWRQSLKHIYQRTGGVQSWIWCYWKLFQLR